MTEWTVMLYLFTVSLNAISDILNTHIGIHFGVEGVNVGGIGKCHPEFGVPTSWHLGIIQN